MGRKKKEVVISKENSFVSEDWYHALVEECRAIKVELGYTARIMTLQSAWELGKRIYEENEGMKRSDTYGDRVLENLATELGMSRAKIFECVQFYKAIPFKESFDDEVVPKLPEGKNITYAMVRDMVLGRKEKREKKQKELYKLSDVLEVTKDWMLNTAGFNEEETEDSIALIREKVIEVKGTK